MIRKLYPGGKKKAFNISYDDGVMQDIRFVALLNRYGLKGTFNLNFGLMHQKFTWVHENGMIIRRLPPWQVKALYEGHEIASHSFSHPYFDSASEMEILKELGSDKFFLEKLFGREVAGYATPFYFYSDLMEHCVRQCGFAYARISEESGDYSIPENFHRWRGSKFHWDEKLEEFIQGFLDTEQELALCQLVGHSYDLDVSGMWERMENLLQMVANDPSIWPATHIDLVRYLNVMNRAEIRQDFITNPGDLPLWFQVEEETICLNPGETYAWKG